MFVFPSCIALVSREPAFYFVALGGWSTDGCSLHGIVDDTIICECNHATNFAALVVSKLCCLSGKSRMDINTNHKNATHKKAKHSKSNFRPKWCSLLCI